MKKFFILFLMLVSMGSCKKENKHPQWDIHVLGPIMKATLGMNELIGDSSLETTFDGAQILAFDTNFSAFNIDSIYQIADTTIPTLYQFPNFPSTILPNQAFSTLNNNISLDLGSLQLKKAIIKSGKIRLEIKNTLNSKIIFTYTIPKALKNGVQFQVVAAVDSGDISSPKFFTGEYDFAGYHVDMTGASGTQVNSIAYNVEARADSDGVAFNVSPLATMIDLKSTLVSIHPLYVKGFLGTNDAHAITTENIGVGGLIKSGTVLLDSVQMNMDIINYIGADAQAIITNLRSVNNKTNTSIDLIAPSTINHYLNFNRASINASLSDSLVPTYYSIQLDKSNSNIKALLENLPDKIIYDINLSLNPQGNISGSNDFVFSDRLIDTRLRIKMPLKFALNQLVLADTVPFSIANATDFEAVGPMQLTIFADNGFPFDMNLQLFLLDQAGQVMDSMLVPDLIAHAPYDASYKALGITRTEIKVPVDEARKARLLSVQRVGVRMKFNTPDYPQYIQFYSTYKLNLKMVADGIYSIR